MTDPTLSVVPGVREAAEEMAREFFRVYVLATFGREDYEWTDDDATVRRGFEDACLALLCDLTRPASMDWWARWLAGRVGLTVGATAPRWRYTDSGWELSVGSGQAWECAYFATASRFHHIVLAYVTVIDVPGIEPVSSNDPTANPAEALRAAILAVRGAS